MDVTQAQPRMIADKKEMFMSPASMEPCSPSSLSGSSSLPRGQGSAPFPAARFDASGVEAFPGPFTIP